MHTMYKICCPPKEFWSCMTSDSQNSLWCVRYLTHAFYWPIGSLDLHLIQSTNRICVLHQALLQLQVCEASKCHSLASREPHENSQSRKLWYRIANIEFVCTCWDYQHNMWHVFLQQSRCELCSRSELQKPKYVILTQTCVGALGRISSKADKAGYTQP